MIVKIPQKWVWQVPDIFYVEKFSSIDIKKKIYIIFFTYPHNLQTLKKKPTEKLRFTLC